MTSASPKKTVYSFIRPSDEETEKRNLLERYFQSERAEVSVNSLISASDYFLAKAHELVLTTNEDSGRQVYCKMVKISIQALLILLNRYKQSLNPKFESIICFKLARIYFSETDNINRAEDYVNRAISIASRNNLVQIKFVSEFLGALILQATNSPLISNYLDERISSLRSMKMYRLANLFTILKINYLMVMDSATGLVVLQSLCRDPEIDVGTKALSFLYQASIHLYRGSPKIALELLEQTQVMDSPLNFPIQLKAMYYLQKLLVLVQTNQSKLSKVVMKEIGKFLLEQQEKGWKSWNEDGTFQISFPIENISNISYRVSWLNSDEFVVIFYFLTGVSMLNNGKNKSLKVFNRCLQIINSQLSQLTDDKISERNFSSTELSKKKLKFTYMKYSVHYYQILQNFMNNDFTSSCWKPLEEFLEKVNTNQFNDEEWTCYQLLVPNILYLFALYHQHSGDLQKAKKYYIKVRDYTSEISRERKSASISFDQSSLGVGGYSFQACGQHNELYVYSSLHLLILTEYELNLSTNIELDNVHKMRQIIYKELSETFTTARTTTSNSFNDSFVNSSTLLSVFYQLLISVYNKEGTNRFDIEKLQVFDTEEFSSDFPVVAGLAYYVSLLGTTSLNHRDKYLKMCVDILEKASNSDNGKVLKIFAQRELLQECIRTGEKDRAIILQLQLQTLIEELKVNLPVLSINNEI
ncbi:hypothetical protein CAAN1_06S06722 [[Candida] anglica]|uniref:Cohesin loading factor n=1 Tax=[Candida] anglica TaxID=148631 RepID=A0ABP0ENL2_9ASCO